MRTNTVLVWAIILCLSHLSSSAQTVEFGGLYGFSGYMGDLQQSHLEVSEIHTAYSVFTRINFSKSIASKIAFTQGTISGSDANYLTLEPRRMRNLSFQSQLYEASLQLEINFLQFGSGEKPLAKTYLFSGVSGYYFNPKAEYKGELLSLQPLGTEGQKLPSSEVKPYDLIQLAIPIGFGFRVMPAKRISLGFELGFRKTFTDYLDDVSNYYPDIVQLGEVNPIAAALSYRTPELGYDAAINPAGTARGEAGKDTYFIGGINLSFIVSK